METKENIEESAEQNQKLSGYEGTGEKDTFGQIEDEESVEAVDKKVDDSKEEADETKEETNENLSEEELKKLQDKAKEDHDKEAEKLSEENESEMDVFEDDKSSEDNEKEKEKEKGEKEETEEPDIFDTKKLEEDLDNESKVKESAKTVDWEKVSSSLKLPDDVKLELKDNSLDSFKEAVTSAIENAKTKTAFDLEGFSNDQKEVINYFMNDGKKADLLNPLKEIDDILLSPAEDKVLGYLVNAEGLSEKDAQAKINDMIEDDSLDNKVSEIDKELHGLRETRYNEIIKSTVDNSSQKAENIKSENKEMVSYIDKLDTFMGTKLPDNVKTYIKKEIETGKLAKANNNAESQIIARLFSLYGNQILKKMQGEAKNASRESYNKGLEKEKKKVHNIPTKKQTQTATKQKEQSNVVDPLAHFVNIDSDSIDLD